MPWSRKQNRLFCARCNNGKGPSDMCKMCHEGVKKSTTDWKAEERKTRRG